jgi:hypothetical protein
MACSALVQPESGATAVIDDEDLKVLDQTRGDAAFTYRRANMRAIRCTRNDLIPAINDYKVLQAGYPLYIVQSERGDTRAGVLEVSGGQYRFRIVQGKLDEQEQQRLLTRLNEIQEASRKRS